MAFHLERNWWHCDGLDVISFISIFRNHRRSKNYLFAVYLAVVAAWISIFLRLHALDTHNTFQFVIRIKKKRRKEKRQENIGKPMSAVAIAVVTIEKPISKYTWRHIECVRVLVHISPCTHHRTNCMCREDTKIFSAEQTHVTSCSLKYYRLP